MTRFKVVCVTRPFISSVLSLCVRLFLWVAAICAEAPLLSVQKQFPFFFCEPLHSPAKHRDCQVTFRKSPSHSVCVMKPHFCHVSFLHPFSFIAEKQVHRDSKCSSMPRWVLFEMRFESEHKRKRQNLEPPSITMNKKMEARASYKQQQSIISSLLYILGTLYVTVPLCGGFHYAHPACFIWSVDVWASSLSSLQVKNNTGIIFESLVIVNILTYISVCSSFPNFLL